MKTNCFALISGESGTICVQLSHYFTSVQMFGYWRLQYNVGATICYMCSGVGFSLF